MGFLYLVDLDEYPKEDIVHCNICETRIGLANDFIDSIDYEMTVVFHKMCNVQVDEEKYHRQVNGNTVADTYCVKCGMLLGMKLIVVPYSNQTLHHREEYFLMNAMMQMQMSTIMIKVERQMNRVIMTMEVLMSTIKMKKMKKMVEVVMSTIMIKVEGQMIKMALMNMKIMMKIEVWPAGIFNRLLQSLNRGHGCYGRNVPYETEHA
uniref:Yippee domain-containing protein n=1 Tax=Solanum lycopersicum TaxID=4081 RepID=A0A3Q7H3M5_SOLLC